ncbi:MAG: hypothetical protein IIC95_07485 [Chloroflexi bacterium]|nr:hypothetical protein [Chloroflexota bacterium]
MNWWERTKRNHGLEHGTITLLLSRAKAPQPMAGYSTPAGFFVVGSLSTEAVRESAEEALRRMQAGEAELAVSPFCGTNIVVGAALTTLATLAGYRLAGRGLAGVNRAFANAVLAIVASRPLGRLVQQRYTTSADLADMHIDDISRHELGTLTIHWVATRA